MNTFWNAIKESAVLDYGGAAQFKSQFQRWLNSYGYSMESLRSWALMFTLSRREFADTLNIWLRENHDSGITAEICLRCNHLDWSNGMWRVTDGPTKDGSHSHMVCGRCVRTYYNECRQCGLWRERVVDGRSFFQTVVSYANICLECLETNAHYRKCSECHRWHHVGNQQIDRWTLVNGRWIFSPDESGSWFCHSCRPPERSRCEPRHPEFVFPALNFGQDRTVAQDEIFEISHGGGDISQTGLREVYEMIHNATRGHGAYGIQVPELLVSEYNFDTRWQTPEGNFPKRVAKLLLNLHHMKLAEDLMSEIGNVAQRYASKPGTYRLSITRDVNQPRSEFVNGDSCWWTNWWWSRCNFKALGGFGLRTWEEDRPVGRAWMIPMKFTGGELVTAPEMLPADAYIVFNGYAPQKTRLDSIEFARLVASMTGKSYRKINFMCNTHLMYVNGTDVHHDSVGKGVLVAAQEICNQVSEYTLRRIPAPRCTCPGKPL